MEVRQQGSQLERWFVQYSITRQYMKRGGESGAELT